MNVTRYPARRSSLSFAPWPEVGQLSNRLNRILGDFMDVDDGGALWIPAVDVEETADELILTADLPGLTSEQVSIELENNVLTISGERTFPETPEDAQRRFHISERRWGAFQRTLSLPRTVSADEITAEFDNGVLAIHMPKMHEARARKIAIRTEG